MSKNTYICLRKKEYHLKWRNPNYSPRKVLRELCLVFIPPIPDYRKLEYSPLRPLVRQTAAHYFRHSVSIVSKERIKTEMHTAQINCLFKSEMQNAIYIFSQSSSSSSSFSKKNWSSKKDNFEALLQRIELFSNIPYRNSRRIIESLS